MNQLQLERALATVKGLTNTVQKNQRHGKAAVRLCDLLRCVFGRQIKARLDYKECSDQEKTRLQERFWPFSSKCFYGGHAFGAARERGMLPGAHGRPAAEVGRGSLPRG